MSARAEGAEGVGLLSDLERARDNWRFLAGDHADNVVFYSRAGDWRNGAAVLDRAIEALRADAEAGRREVRATWEAAAALCDKMERESPRKAFQEAAAWLAECMRQRALATPPAAPAAGVPDGWKLVPVFMTAAMSEGLRVGMQSCASDDGWDWTARKGYEAMLAAAPSPPAAPGGGTPA